MATSLQLSHHYAPLEQVGDMLLIPAVGLVVPCKQAFGVLEMYTATTVSRPQLNKA